VKASPSVPRLSRYFYIHDGMDGDLVARLAGAADDVAPPVLGDSSPADRRRRLEALSAPPGGGKKCPKRLFSLTAAKATRFFMEKK
jgi:hypothetical protein